MRDPYLVRDPKQKIIKVFLNIRYAVKEHNKQSYGTTTFAQLIKHKRPPTTTSSTFILRVLYDTAILLSLRRVFACDVMQRFSNMDLALNQAITLSQLPARYIDGISERKERRKRLKLTLFDIKEMLATGRFLALRNFWDEFLWFRNHTGNGSIVEGTL